MPSEICVWGEETCSWFPVKTSDERPETHEVLLALRKGKTSDALFSVIPCILVDLTVFYM